MLIKTILFKNNLIKKIKSKNILKTKKKFLELKKDYKKKKIPLLTSFEKNYKLGYSKKLVKVLRKNKNIILGTWQDLYLFEHRLKSQNRKISHHLMGD